MHNTALFIGQQYTSLKQSGIIIVSLKTYVNVWDFARSILNVKCEDSQLAGVKE